MAVLNKAPFKKLLLEVLYDILWHKLEFLELSCVFYQIHMAQEDCPAAVPVKPELIQYFLSIFPFGNSLLKGFP